MRRFASIRPMLQPFLLLLLISGVKGQSTVTVEFFDDALNVDEGDHFNVRLIKQGSNLVAFMVIVEVENDVDGDFVGRTQVARFPAEGSDVTSVSFSVQDDGIPEDEELFFLHIFVQDPFVKKGKRSRIPVIVRANDDAYGIFRLDQVSPMIVTEKLFSSVVELSVKRELSYFGRVQVSFLVNSTSEEAELNADILPVTGFVSFQALQREAKLQLQIRQDRLPEKDEHFFVTLVSATENAQVLPSSVEVVIAANDAAVRFTSAEYRFEEGPDTRTVKVQVTRGLDEDGISFLGPLNGEVSVDYQFISGSARDPVDFTGTDGTIVFRPGDARKEISFLIMADDMPEEEESFQIRLMNLRGDGVLLSPRIALILINANDNPSGIISFHPGPDGGAPLLLVNEDSFTNVEFDVDRLDGTFGEVSVFWSIFRDAGSSSVSDDVGPVQGTLFFAAGQNTAKIALTIVQDNAPEPVETFTVRLEPSSVTGSAKVEGLLSATLVVQDSDDVYGTVEFGPGLDHKLVTDVNPRLLQLSLTRSGGRVSNLEVNVSVTYDDGTHEIEDSDVLGSSVLTVIMPAGQDPVIVNFELLPSTFLVVGGEFRANITGIGFELDPINGAYNSPKLGFRKEISVFVSTSEANGETGFFNVTNLVVDEPESGITEVGLLVSREGLNGDATVRWSISGKDITLDDVVALEGTITLKSGVPEVILPIGIKADDIPEVMEVMIVTLDSIEPFTSQRLRPGSTSVTVTINANDNPGGIIQFSPEMDLAYDVEEGQAAIEIILERTGGDLVERTVLYSVEPNGAEEFFGSTNVLVFLPGQRVARATILAMWDGVPEMSEDFKLILTPIGDPPPVLGERTSIDITIPSNDNPYGVIRFFSDPTVIYTGEGQNGETINVTLPVKRDRGSFGTVVVSWTINPEGQEDLFPSSGSLVFEPGETEKDLSVIVVDDGLPERDETFVIQLSAPEGGAVSGIPMVATVVIQENDNPVEFTETLIYVSEPESFQLTVIRKGNADKRARVSYRTLDGSASSVEGDYVRIGQRLLEFAPGEKEKTVDVSVLDDTRPEGNETFSLQLFDVGGDLIVTTSSTATIVILANDNAYGVFGFAQPTDRAVEEGSTVFFDVVRGQGNFGSVRLFWEMRSMNNILLAAGEDFDVVSGHMDFSPQENKRPLAITPRDDGIPETTEQYLVVLTKVEVISGLRSVPLASLDNSGRIATVRVSASNDPFGRMAFASDARELSVAEDIYPGDESSRSATFTVERRQGTQNEVQVLWEIFSDELGGNLPPVYDLLFMGKWPETMNDIPSKRRYGTMTPVLLFSGASDQYVTVLSEPDLESLSSGFSLSAWVQPFPNTDGYIIACTSEDGNTRLYSLKSVATDTTTSITVELSTETEQNQVFRTVVSRSIQDGLWHHLFVSYGNATVFFYMDGMPIGSRAISGSSLLTSTGTLLVGALSPGSENYVGYMQDVRILMRALDESAVKEIYLNAPFNDVLPISGMLTYPAGVRTQTFTVASQDDIEEEGREVFAVILLSTTGGAELSTTDSRTTLSVLKSDNANGLFGFEGPCSPDRVESEISPINCVIQRTRGDDGTVTLSWMVSERKGGNLEEAKEDFVQSQGQLLFLPGERKKTLTLNVIDDSDPELEELFEVRLTKAVSDDGLVGTTNTSGPSIDERISSFLVVVEQNDYPYGLLQFSDKLGIVPELGLIIEPVDKVVKVNVSEEGGLVPLVVVRAQGTLGTITAEWRTKDVTALSEGKSPPDYVLQGAVGSISMAPGENYAFINITVKDNGVPEAEKKFEVQLLNPTNGVALGIGAKVVVTIEASDAAFGIFEFADSSLNVAVAEVGDEGFNTLSLEVLRLGGLIGGAAVTWEVEENKEDGLDILNPAGMLTFNANQASSGLEIRVRGDTLPELDEIVTVKLLVTFGGELGNPLKTTATVTIQANDDPYGRFSIPRLFRPKLEEETDHEVPVTIQRLGGTYGVVRVNYVTLAPRETYPFLPGPVLRADTSDFSPVSGSVTFEEGQDTEVFQLRLLDDVIPEQDESVFVRLISVQLVTAAQLTPVPNSPRLGLVTETYGQIIITSNDDASGRLELSPSSLTVLESNPVPQVYVVRSGGTYGEVSVAFRAVDNTAVLNFDYIIQSTFVVLASGETSKRVPIEVIDDRAPELSESFTIELIDQLTGGAVLGDIQSSVITILPSDDPNGVFTFVSTGQTVTEESRAYSVELTVIRTGGSQDVVTVSWKAFLNGQAPAGDISPVSGSVFFVTNEASRTITISILPDDIPEGAEMIEIRLTRATNGGRIGEQNVYTLTIAPNDSPHGSVQLSSSVYSVPESGADGPQVAQVVRSGGVYGRLHVYYSTSAFTLMDEVNLAREEVLDFFLTPVPGALSEEGFSVDVSSANDTLNACARACLVEPRCRSFQHQELEAGILCTWFLTVFTPGELSIVGNSDYYQKDTIKVKALQMGIAIPGEDFTSVIRNSVTMEDGQSSVSLPLSILEDEVPELDERFRLQLVDVEIADSDITSNDAPILGDILEASVVITTSDNAFGVFRVYSESLGPSKRTVEVMESDRLAVDFVVEREGGSIGEVTVAWSLSTQGRTATYGEDYVADGATLVFGIGQTRRVISVTLLEDTVPEDQEELTVVLSNPTGGASLSTDDNIKIVILANDFVAGLLSFERTSILTTEGDDFKVTIRRSLPALGTVTAEWIIEGAGGLEAVNSFNDTTGQLRFLPTETEKSVFLSVLVDDKPEVNEEYSLTLTDIVTEGVGPTGAAQLDPQRGRLLLTIAASDEPHGIVQFTESSLRMKVEENAGTVSLLLDRKFGVIGVIRVTYEVVRGSLDPFGSQRSPASAGQDFIGVPSGFVDIGNGQASGNIDISIIDDDIPEIDEVFVARLTGVSLIDSTNPALPPKLANENTEAEITINANDGARGIIIFAPDSRSVSVTEQGQPFSLTVLRSQGTFGQVSVFYYSQAVTESTVQGQDFNMEADELVFEEGESRKSITINVLDDDEPEPDEMFEVILARPSNGAVLGQDIRATVTILENDVSGGFISFDSADFVQLSEPVGDNPSSSKAEILLRRGPGSFEETIVPFTVRTQQGQMTNDIIPQAGSVTFLDRQTTAVLTLEVVDDDVPEMEETFILSLQTPSGTAVLGDVNTKSLIVGESDAPFGLFQIYTANTRLSSVSVEEKAQILEFDVVRSQGSQGKVTVDVQTIEGSATAEQDLSRVVLAPLATPMGAAVSYWQQVDVGSTTFLVMLSSLPSDTQLKSLLSADSPVGAGQSFLYRWQGQLTYHRTFITDGATAATSFDIAGNTYLVVANGGREGARQVSSIVYRISENGDMEMVQGLPTSGASDVAYFSHDSRHFLFVTNSLDDNSRSDISSHLYLWNADQAKFSTAPWQLISTLRASSVVSFNINGQTFVAIANNYDRSRGSYEISSVLLRMESDLTLVQHQQITTQGAVGLAYLTVAATHFLIVANNRQDTVVTPQDSAVYRWDVLANAFVLHQTLRTSRANSVSAVTIDRNSALVIFANGVGNSEVFVWKVEKNLFESAWKGKPYHSLQPMTIVQPSGSLHMLGAADIERQGQPYIFQIAQVSDSSDFVPRRVTMTFDAGETLLRSSVMILTDETPEDTESFSVALTSPTDGAQLGLMSTVTVEVLSNDDAHGIIEFAEDSLSVTAEELENSDLPVQLNVVRKQGFYGTVRVAWQATGDHSGVGDITPLSGQVEFASGYTVATITLTVRDDDEPEFAEVTYVSLTEILDTGTDLEARGAKLGTATMATITVLANDSPYGVVSWKQSLVTVAEPESTDQAVELMVTRQQGLEQAIRISYVTSMASQLPVLEQATAGEDFVSAQSSIVMAEGVQEVPITIVIKQDSVPETVETFLVNLTSVTLLGSDARPGAGPSIAVGKSVIQVSITENDNARGIVEMDVKTNIEGRIDVYEEYGKNVTLELPLKRLVGFFGSVVVDWEAISITADPDDYSPSLGKVEFKDQDRESKIVITIIDDAIAEEMEMFEVRLYGVSGDAGLGSSRSVTVAVLKNDSPGGLFRFATSEVETRESLFNSDSSGQAILVVDRIQGNQGVVDIKWRLNAEAQADFLPPLEGTLRFDGGQTELSFALQTRPDTKLEGREEFIVSLVSVDSSADISPTEGDCTVVILPDPGASGTISILPESRQIIIGEPGESSPGYKGEAEIRLTRGQGIFGEVIITWSLTPRDLSAFLQVEGSVKFVDLQQTASIVLQTRDDSIPELAKSFTVQVNSASGGAVVSSVPGTYTADVIFAASDYPHGLVQFSLPEVMEVSEDQQVVRMTVARGKGRAGQIRVAYTTVPGTATEYADFLPSAGTLTFQATEVSKNIEVTLQPDTVPEGQEEFYVKLTSIELLGDSNDYSEENGLARDMAPALGTLISKTVIISKNDNAEGTIQFDESASRFEVKEDVGIALVPVIRTGGSFGQISVKYATETGTATEGIDYVASVGSLILDDGVTQATVNITIKDDSIMEPSESFTVVLFDASGGAQLGPLTTSTVVIVKSDYPNGRFAFQGPSEISLANPVQPTEQLVLIERTAGVLGTQQVYWRIMGPNNPNLQLEDTSDISHLDNGREVTTGSILWVDGESGVKQLQLEVKPYTSWEVAKTFVLELYRVIGTPSGIGNGEVDTASGQVVIKIEKFGEPNGVIRFTGPAVEERQVLEPSGAVPIQLIFPIARRTGTGVTGNVQVYWEVQGSDLQGSDLQPMEGSVILESGRRDGQIKLEILPDQVPELTESFSLVLLRAEGGAEIDSQFYQSRFNIRYNDYPHGQFGIRSEDQFIEVDPSDLTRRIRLNFTRHEGTFGAVILTFTISYDIDDSGVVLEKNTGTVTFNDGESQTFSLITISGNAFLRLGSTFTVYIRDPQHLGPGVTEPPTVRSGESKAQVTVPPLAANSLLSFSTDEAYVDNAEGTLTVTLMRLGVYGSLEANWASGYSPADRPDSVVNGEIVPSLGKSNMAHGQEETQLTVQVSPQVNQVETFILRLPRAPVSLVSGGARLASSGLEVQADPSGVVRFSPHSLKPTASELDGQVSLTLWRLYGSEGRIAVNYRVIPDTASELDFDSGTELVYMEPYSTMVTFTVQIYQDNIPEQSEKFYVNLTSVELLPTPVEPVGSPRLNGLFALSHVTIKESNDAYGILSLRPSEIDVTEVFSNVTLTVVRSGGLFGAVSVTVRTVGGGEEWQSQIVNDPDSESEDTIADVLGKPSKMASQDKDYIRLNTVVEFQNNEKEKSVNLSILQDNLPEPEETIFVYLTQPVGGARIAEGTPDGGLKGYTTVNIAASDNSNGIIGFDPASRKAEVNEDNTSKVTLKLIRLKSFIGSVQVSWIAKRSLTSSAQEDAELSSQLNTTAGVTTCPPEISACNLDVFLIDDSEPEESYSFIVLLTDAGEDAQLNEDSLVAEVTILPSDDIRGLLQFSKASRLVIVGESSRSASLNVERIQGQDYDVSVGYLTLQVLDTETVSGVVVYPALDTQDFQGQTGSLSFQPGSQAFQSVQIRLLPDEDSDNPLPKQFLVQLNTPSNGARVNTDTATAIVRIVKDKDVALWKSIPPADADSFSDDDIMATVGKLDDIAQQDLSENNMDMIEDYLDRVNAEGNRRRLPSEVVSNVKNLYCALLSSENSDARKGRHTLANKLETFAYTLVKDAPCPPENLNDLVSTSCVNVKISAGRWTPSQLAGHKFTINPSSDTFAPPQSLRNVDTNVDGKDDECVDFHFLEYSSQTWFYTNSGEDDLMRNRVIGFGLKGTQSQTTQDPVTFRIHTPDRRIAAKRAKCVYFSEDSDKWIGPSDVCEVTNNLALGTDDFVDCECKHMSSYAVITSSKDDGIIGYVTWFYVTCFICMGCMLLVVMVHHLCFSQTTFTASLQMHFFMAIFFTLLCLVLDTHLSPDDILAYNTREDNSECIAMGLFLHYFFLAQFTWMATQAVNLWKVLILNDEHTDRHYVVFFIIGWGVPLVLVAIFYAVTFNIYKYHTDIDVDFIYGDVNNNGEVCFITNEYAALGGILGPVLIAVLVLGIVFVKAYQVSSQWEAYDDIYRGRYNSKEVPLFLLLWGLLLLTCLWLALHMMYGYLWMMVLFSVCCLLLSLLVLLLYAVFRNPCFACWFGPIKASYSVSSDLAGLPPPDQRFNPYPSNQSIKGSATSLLNDAWENNTTGGRSRMTVKRALPSQVYMNPPIAVISPPATIDSDNPDFDDLIYALKMGRSISPSEMSRSIDDDFSQLSVTLDRYETKHIDIADTHL